MSQIEGHMEQVTEDRVRNICRDMIDIDCEKFCALRHKPISDEVDSMQQDNKIRDTKLDSIHKLAYGIMGGIIVSLVVQVLAMLDKAPK